MYRISICGTAGTGKDTLGKMLVKLIRDFIQLHSPAKYLAFADPIKEMAKQMYPNIPKKHLFGSSKFRNNIIPGSFCKDGSPLTIRQLLMDLGTEVARSYDQKIWLNNFDIRYNKIENYYKFLHFPAIIVVTDTRFINEVQHLKEKGFYQIRLYRTDVSQKFSHISEAGQVLIPDSEFDYVLHNNGKLSDLKDEVINNIIPVLRNE